MKLIQIKEFNKQARARYNKAVENWDHNTGGFPFLPMYIFALDNGEERKNGWVASDKNKHVFALNKEQAINKFNNS